MMGYFNSDAIGSKTRIENVIIIIIMARMAVFYVAGCPIEERRRWPVITNESGSNLKVNCCNS